MSHIDSIELGCVFAHSANLCLLNGKLNLLHLITYQEGLTPGIVLFVFHMS